MTRFSQDALLGNMFFQITYAADRRCTIDWKLKGKDVYDRHNLIFVYDGEAELLYNNKAYHIGKGDLVYYRPGDQRLGHTMPENLMKCFTVDFFYTHPVCDEGFWELKNFDLPFDYVEKMEDSFLYTRVYALFAQLIRNCFFNDPKRMVRAKAVFMQLLELLLSWKLNPDFNYDHLRKVEKIIRFMSDHYNKKITLEELAALSGVSPTYLENIFRKVTGVSPITYLIQLRLQQAKNFMQDGHSVTDTAAKVGFNDVFYFSKCFKKYEGESPVHFLQNRNMF